MLSSYNYRYNNNNELESFIYSAHYLKDKKEFYIKLISSNLGNCSNCEWQDFFKTNGSYVGSTRGLFENGPLFHKKPLTKAMAEKLFSLDEIKIQTITTAKEFYYE